MRVAAAICALLMGLSACSEVPAPTPVSATAGPGPAFMSPFDAGVIFADVCLTRGPAFGGAKEAISGFAFTQNASTGTYYHNTYDLSVKVTKAQCSLVFSTSEPIKATVKGLAQGTASVEPSPPTGISVTSSKDPNGRTYFRLGIHAKR